MQSGIVPRLWSDFWNREGFEDPSPDGPQREKGCQVYWSGLPWSFPIPRRVSVACLKCTRQSSELEGKVAAMLLCCLKLLVADVTKSHVSHYSLLRKREIHQVCRASQGLYANLLTLHTFKTNDVIFQQWRNFVSRGGGIPSVPPNMRSYY